MGLQQPGDFLTLINITMAIILKSIQFAVKGKSGSVGERLDEKGVVFSYPWALNYIDPGRMGTVDTLLVDFTEFLNFINPKLMYNGADIRGEIIVDPGKVSFNVVPFIKCYWRGGGASISFEDYLLQFVSISQVIEFIHFKIQDNDGKEKGSS